MKALKEMKWEAIFMGLLYIILGIALIVEPNQASDMFVYVVAAILLISGAISIISYFVRNAVDNYHRNDFFNGIILVSFGVVMLIQLEQIKELVAVILGLMVIIDGCMLLQDAVDMKRLKCGNFALVLVLALIVIAFGFLLVSNPFKSAELLMICLGAGIAVSGLLTIITTVMLFRATQKAIRESERIADESKESIEEEQQ